MKFPEYIDYYIGKRIKTKYTYYPYKLTFDYLELGAMDAIKLFWVFQRADRDSSGIIDSFEWLMYLDVERTPFNEKIFAIVDFDNSGEMDFREFVMCCWNYASATPVDLINLAFFLYSSDGVILKQDEVLAMLRQIFGDKVETNPQARKIKVELLVICEQWNGIDLSQVRVSEREATRLESALSFTSGQRRHLR